MVNIYKTEEGKLRKLKEIEEDTWIDLVSPTIEEIEEVVKKTKVDADFLKRLLDSEEIPHIEMGKKSTLIVVHYPYLVDSAYKNKYYIHPLGIIIGSNHFITISLKPITLLDEFKENKVKDLFTEKKTRFTFQILYRIASLYQKHLKAIDEDINNREKHLRKSTKNKELLDLLNIEKTLVYFTTSLKANDIVLDKLSKGTILQLFEEDNEILEDAIIENKQSIEMANVYREILSSMTDTYATIISNNLNVVMKFLAGITIVVSVPTMIASFLGMNVNLGFVGSTPYAFLMIVLISVVFSLIIAHILKDKDML
ncbi:MAG: magnesium transporter CorA family protein [Bacilli bacterium]|nr:magnesium transporter CorA family protein [Bacilli bacterium]